MMRVLTGEEVDRLERGTIPVSQRKDRIPGVFDAAFSRMVSMGYLIREIVHPNERGGTSQIHNITPRGLLALRCHRAFLASNGAST